MFCPHCGNQNREPAETCSFCGRPLIATPPPPMPPGVVAGVAVAPAPSYAAQLPPSLAVPTSMHVLGMVGVVAFILLAVFLGLLAPVPDLPNQTQADGYRIGRLLSSLLFPFLIAYAIAGRRRARKPNLFAGLFCGIGLLMLFSSLVGSLPAGSFQPETTDQKVARLMREAAGLQPVRKTFFAEAKTDTQLRDFFKQIFVLNKDYQADVDKLDMSGAVRLNTPESFADPDLAADGLRQLHAAYDLDLRQEQRMSEVLENFRHSFDGLSASDREAMIKGFDQGLAKVMPARQHVVSTEKGWIDALDDIYNFAQANHSQFRMSAGHLQVANDDVRQEFNTRIRTLNASRQEFLQAKKTFDTMQGQSLQKTGITRSQTGLH